MKISKSLFIMRQVKHILDRKSMKTLYYSLIHPHITYCLLAWGNANKNILKKNYYITEESNYTYRPGTV